MNSGNKPGFSSWLRAVLVSVLLAAITGCTVESNLDTTTTDRSDGEGFDADGAAVRVLNATSNTSWVYFNLETNSVVYPADPDNSTQWDIAFKRFVIKINGGVSGTAEVGAATFKDTKFVNVSNEEVSVPENVNIDPASLTYDTDIALAELSDSELIQLNGNPFFAVCMPPFDCIDEVNRTVDRAHLNTDTKGYVFLLRGSGQVITAAGNDDILGWYDYYLEENHILRPAGDTWIVRTAGGKYVKFEMLGYYGLNEDRESGNMAFRYKSMTPGFEVPPPGGAQLQAAITADAVAGVAPLAVDFSADVSGGTATQWNWDFGDGATASGSSVSHVYQNAGNYTVKLTVTDDRGVVVNASRPITVEPAGNLAPNADAGPDQIIQLGASEAQRTVTLNGSLSSDGDGHITTYRWSGTPDPDDIAGPVVSLGAGSYEFTLTVSDDNGNSDTDTVTITVNSPDNLSPTAVSSVSANKGAAPFATEFTGSASSDPDGAIVTYRWEFGDGQTADVADTAHTYTVPGTYTAKLTVTDDKGAIATGTVVVTVTLVAPAIQDTYDYEFLGNQGAPSGDSGGILTWNHESNHGAKGLIQLDATWMSNLPAGANYTARLWLYAVCEISGFVGACPGYPDADNPYTPGLGTTKTDVLIQGSAWTEGDALTWANITETSAPSASITQDSSAAGWVSVDVTSLIAAIKAGGTDFGFSLSQENYPVLRADNGSVMVSKFCDSESSGTGICSTGSFKPYLEITVHAP